MLRISRTAAYGLVKKAEFNAFNRLKKNAGLPNVVFHSLRHSSTTYKLKRYQGHPGRHRPRTARYGDKGLFPYPR